MQGEPLRFPPRQQIGHIPAIGVIDLPEPVDVHFQHRQPALPTLGNGHGLGQVVLGQKAVGRVGQAVVKGQVFDALTGGSLLGNVTAEAEHGRLAVITDERPSTCGQFAEKCPSAFKGQRFSPIGRLSGPFAGRSERTSPIRFKCNGRISHGFLLNSTSLNQVLHEFIQVSERISWVSGRPDGNDPLCRFRCRNRMAGGRLMRVPGGRRIC